MSLATGEGEAYPIDRPGRSGRLLPHHPLRGSFPRWGKHRRPSDNGQGQAPPLRSSPPSPVSLRGQCALPPLKGEVSPALAPVTEGFLRSLRPPQGRLSAARVPAPVPDRRPSIARPYGANGAFPVSRAMDFNPCRAAAHLNYSFFIFHYSFFISPLSSLFPVHSFGPSRAPAPTEALFQKNCPVLVAFPKRPCYTEKNRVT